MGVLGPAISARVHRMTLLAALPWGCCLLTAAKLRDTAQYHDTLLIAAMSRLHSLGIADLTPGVLQQLIAKHPTRDHSVPDALPVHALPAVDPLDLTDIFRGLRRRAGTGPSGRRNEHLRALVGDFGDSRADRVIAQGPMQADFFRHQADIWQAVAA